MPRHLRLGQSQSVDEIANRRLPVAEGIEEFAAAAFGNCVEGIRCRRSTSHIQIIWRYRHMSSPMPPHEAHRSAALDYPRQRGVGHSVRMGGSGPARAEVACRLLDMGDVTLDSCAPMAIFEDRSGVMRMQRPKETSDRARDVDRPSEQSAPSASGDGRAAIAAWREWVGVAVAAMPVSLEGPRLLPLSGSGISVPILKPGFWDETSRLRRRLLSLRNGLEITDRRGAAVRSRRRGTPRAPSSASFAARAGRASRRDARTRQFVEPSGLFHAWPVISSGTGPSERLTAASATISSKPALSTSRNALQDRHRYAGCAKRNQQSLHVPRCSGSDEGGTHPPGGPHDSKTSPTHTRR